MYSFIPDSGFVGTCFVNALSNQLVCFGHRASLQIECRNGIKIIDDEDPSLTICDDINTQQDQATINVGSLQYGQDRHFLLHISLPDGMSEEEIKENLNCSLTYTSYSTSTSSTIPSSPSTSSSSSQTVCCTDCNLDQSSESILEMEIQSFRLRLIHFIFTVIKNGVCGDDDDDSDDSENESKKSRSKKEKKKPKNNSPATSLLAYDMKEWLKKYPKSRRKNSPTDLKHDIVNGMLDDLTGQITEVCLFVYRLL